MDDNEHDSITVDEYILPKLSKEQKSLLEDIGYLGYVDSLELLHL
jgi:hypothetical protein